MKRWTGFIVFALVMGAWRGINNRLFKTYVETSRDTANRRR
jgi:hypothetical protein